MINELISMYHKFVFFYRIEKIHFKGDPIAGIN